MDQFIALNSLEDLKKLDESFLLFVQKHDLALYDTLILYRADAPQKPSKFLISLAPILDDFLAELFDIEKENSVLKQAHEAFDSIYEVRRKFVQRHALKKYPSVDEIDFSTTSKDLSNLIGNITEKSLAASILVWLDSPAGNEHQLDIAARYCAYMVHNNSSLVLFDVPRKIDPEDHIRTTRIEKLKKHTYLGFNSRDYENSMERATAHAKYCIYCHKQEKDSCSHGTEDQNGCPLDQKISEMNLLKSKGYNIGALGIITIDNPMVAATGHRICNDCMKACIFQKQDPVNIPMAESNILEQVLSLPYGVEIYALLTKWNPLNLESPLPKENTGQNILVTGLGPAGFALAHYLLNEGHNVTAIDGLKISPLHFDASNSVKDWQDIKLPLSEKMPQGFGGVAEYGITNRWDKNNLTLIRLILERRKNFNMYGGIRLGSNITTNQAFDLGFDHISLCLGAGKPRFMASSEYFAKGVRPATDFLMNLQQGAPYISGSNSNLLVRMPAMVIGCGLTAIDAAIELLHYYPAQVEAFLQNYDPSIELSEEDLEIANELIKHARLFRAAKDDAEKLEILKKLGGVTICYRKTIKESPAYKLNHEEIEHAIAMGVVFEENTLLTKINTDRFGYVSSIKTKCTPDTIMCAKTILLAIGTENNEFEDIDNLDEESSAIFKRKDNKISYFGDCNQKYAGSVVKAIASAKNGYKAISSALSNSAPAGLSDLADQIKSHIHAINILSDDIIEIIVHSPLAAQNFKPGQFYKLQNHSSDISKIMEPLALTGSYVDKKSGLISLIVLEMGGSSKLCRNLKAGEEISLMGPTGMPTEIVLNQKVALIGGGLGNAVLTPIAKALKENNCHITYFAGYRKAEDRFYLDRIEEFADLVVWSCDTEKLSQNRGADLSVQGNIIDGIKLAKERNLINDTQHVICIGSDRMMKAVSSQSSKLFGTAKFICSINSPMQCMMKGICGQCVQKVDDDRGYIFSCANQDQEAKIVDFDVLGSRLGQNSLLEKVVG